MDEEVAPAKLGDTWLAGFRQWAERTPVCTMRWTERSFASRINVAACDKTAKVSMLSTGEGSNGTRCPKT